MPPDPPRGKGPYGPFGGHIQLSHFQWPLVTNAVETPDCVCELHKMHVKFFHT